MSSIILEFDRNPQISEIDRLQSFMESVQRAFNEIEVSYDDLELEKHPLIGTISKDNQDFKVLFKDYAQFKVVTANAVEAIKGTFETLETEYARIDMANIGTAWVEDLLVKGSFIAKEVDAGTGQFTKYLAGVRIHGDLIEANTLRANTLIIRGDDGIYRRLNIDSLGQTTVDSDPKYNQGLDGSIIVAESITATKIAGHTITAEQIRSNTITTTELNASEIFANEANINILTATDVFANAISTNKVLVGTNEALETLDKFVATWKHSSDVTLIDGGKIYTGSITVDRLNADELQARVGTYGYLKANVLESEVGKFGYLKTNELESEVGKFGYLKANELSVEVAKLGYATVSNLNAAVGRIETLETQTITADKINVDSIFAQDINATGKITGAKLYGALVETDEGKVAGWTIGTDGLSISNYETTIYGGSGQSLQCLVSEKLHTKPTSALLRSGPSGGSTYYIPAIQIDAKLKDYTGSAGTTILGVADANKMATLLYNSGGAYLLLGETVELYGNTVWLYGSAPNPYYNSKALAFADHTHDYAPTSHSHSNYSTTDHTHSQYAATCSGTVAYGTDATKVSAGAYKEVKVTFPNGLFASAPVVVACLNTNANNSGFAGCSIAVLKVETTGATFRIYNNTSIERTPGYNWIATA